MKYSITSYPLCLKLRQAEFSKDTYSYYFNKSKNVLLASDVVPVKDFFRHYTPAYSTSELLSLVPSGTMLTKNQSQYVAKFKSVECTEKTPADALASLLLLLKRIGDIT